MSAHIPEHRHAINGRTFDREWHPEAIEHSRRHWTREAVAYAAFVAFLLLFVLGLPALAHLIATWSIR